MNCLDPNTTKISGHTYSSVWCLVFLFVLEIEHALLATSYKMCKHMPGISEKALHTHTHPTYVYINNLNTNLVSKG